MHPFLSALEKNKVVAQNNLCVGLDPDLSKIPNSYSRDIEGLYQFLTAIIRCTEKSCIAYKPNISFFEALGIDGLKLLERIVKYIPSSHPVIIDAKRGDIGNTSKMQAKFIFDYFGAQAVTLHPYMGDDSLEPFFAYKDSYHFVLALTSNPGASRFETNTLSSGEKLYEAVTKAVVEWNETYHNIGLVVGATQSEMKQIRSVDESLLYLIPGVGAQGAAYSDCLKYGTNNKELALINVGRALLYDVDHTNLEQSVLDKVKQLVTT